MTRVNTSHRKNERGITIVLVAISLFSLLGMAALAIDVSTLYMAHGEAQRAADAAALAGARMFATSGYTSASSDLAASDICQTSAVPSAAAAANRQAEAVAAQNLIAGQPAAVQSITCNLTAANPQISVTIQRTALPTFFGRIWGGPPTASPQRQWPRPTTRRVRRRRFRCRRQALADTELRSDQWRSRRLRARGRFVDNTTGAFRTTDRSSGKLSP